jgi:hypothetical protein
VGQLECVRNVAKAIKKALKEYQKFLEPAKADPANQLLERDYDKTDFGEANRAYLEIGTEDPIIVQTYNDNQTEESKKEAMDRSKDKIEKSSEELTNIKERGFSEYFNSLYENYNEYLETLSPDKIVCVFNIIMGYMTISSFLSILAILLSESVINKIKYLERFPFILDLLKLRININKKIIIFYLTMHFFIILMGLLGNLYMFFFNKFLN